ncbi:MAG: hypothetical protein ACLGH6_01655 [Gammaproteobacteria bacterium]
MTDKFKNPLIGFQPAETFDRVNGMLDLLKSVDYAGRTCGPMPERAEIALMHCMDLMQDALKYEAGRVSKGRTAA